MLFKVWADKQLSVVVFLIGSMIWLLDDEEEYIDMHGNSINKSQRPQLEMPIPNEYKQRPQPEIPSPGNYAKIVYSFLKLLNGKSIVFSNIWT